VAFRPAFAWQPQRSGGSLFSLFSFFPLLPVCLLVFVLLPLSAYGAKAPPPLRPFAAQGTVQYAFAPDDDAAGLIIGAIDRARHRVLVQAYSFTHRGIADALIRAYRRGVDVAVIADAEQARTISAHALRQLIHAGVPVLLDAAHAAAHNKIVITDPDAPDCAVITGSYNFTYAAEYHNAENLLVLRSDPPLCAAYRDDWERHRTHAHAER
jgi:phosphatidylserine/phosphatidylglycerophosphate/cardiolipin synthase-like enzyme